MKKRLTAAAILLAAAVTSGAVTPLTALSVGNDIVKKELTSYVFSMDKTKRIDCVFSSSLPEVPYITAEDYLCCIYDGEFFGSKNPDGTYSVSTSTGKMVIDTDKDTVFFGAGEDLIGEIEAVKDGTVLEAPYCDSIYEKDEDGVDITYDLGTYGIDLIEADGKAYFPLTTVSDIFYSSYNAGVYYDDCIYFVHSSDEMNAKSYFEKSKIYDKTTRSPEMIKYTYNEMCFIIDTMYGCPAKSQIAPMIRQKGFDGALREFSDESRKAQQLLLSEDMVDFIAGMSTLSLLFNDGGHTLFDYMIVFMPEGTAIANELILLMSDSDNASVAAIRNSVMQLQKMSIDSSSMSSIRASEYAKYETVKKWDNEAAASFIRKGETGVFVFDHFNDDAVTAFKWSLDYARDNGIRRFIIDVSCNGGGSKAAMYYMLGIMKNGDNHTNILTDQGLDTYTGKIDQSKAYFDFNLDGKFDDLDKDVSYDFEFAVLASHFSFSCGNLLPVFAQDNGIAVLGERSGGGECAVGMFYTPELAPYSISSASKAISSRGICVDDGAVPDYDLVGSPSDYKLLYDIDRVGACVDSFYSGTQLPEQSGNAVISRSGFINDTLFFGSEQTDFSVYIWLFIGLAILFAAVIVCVVFVLRIQN